MTIHLLRDLDHLRREILLMGGMVEEAIGKSIMALVQRDQALADEVITGEALINAKELEIAEDALKILALHQPVASDLRFLIAVLQVNNDLERMGDLAENIAGRARQLAEMPLVKIPIDLMQMADNVRHMVKDSLDALVNQDAGAARTVCERDDAVDRAHRETYRLVQDLMKEDPDLIDQAVQFISVSRQLERIADHATNIAEDVVFMAEGVVIRHREGGGRGRA